MDNPFKIYLNVKISALYLLYSSKKLTNLTYLKHVEIIEF